MYLAVHTSAALMISQHSGSHLQAFLFGLISHAILDMIPHGDYHMFRWFNRGSKKTRMALLCEIDIIISTIIAAASFYIYSASPTIFIWALVGSWLPDIPHLFFHLSKERFMVRLSRWHANLHLLENKIRLSMKQSLVLQILVVIIIFLLM